MENSAKISHVVEMRTVRTRGFALRNEHGALGFLFEPLVAANAIAPSLGGFWISVFFIGAFLTRQPLRIYLADRAANRNLPQTAVALKFMSIYGSIAAIGAIGAFWFAKIDSFIPLLVVAPFGIYQVYCDVSRKSRQLLPELTGSIAISSSAAMIALAGGWRFTAALALWAIFISRLVPSILYVRNRLKLEKGKEFSLTPVFISSFVALCAVGLMAGNGLASIITLGVFVVLLLRAVIGLSPYRRRIKAMKIGIWEVIYGVLTVLSVIIGYYAGF